MTSKERLDLFFEGLLPEEELTDAEINMWEHLVFAKIHQIKVEQGDMTFQEHRTLQ